MKKLLLMTAAIAGILSFGSGEARAEYCREYTRTIYIGGQAQQGYGTACQMPDGSWEIASENLPTTATNYSNVTYDDTLYFNQRSYVVNPPYAYNYRRVYYRNPSPSINIVFGNNGRYHNRWDNRFDRGWNRGGHDHGGRGYGHHRH